MKIRVRWPKFEEVTLLYFLLIPLLRDVVFSHIPGNYITMDIILTLLVLYGVIRNRREIWKYIDIVIFFLILSWIFFIQFFSNPIMTEWLTREYGVKYMFINAGIFGYPVMRIQKSPERMLEIMKISGIILGLYYAYQSLEVLRVGYWTYTQFGREVHKVGNMSWSYGLLFVICCLSIYIINERRIFFLAPIILCLIGILVYGSRGTMVSFSLGLFLGILLIHEGKMKAQNYILFGLLILAIVFFFSDIGLTILTDWFSARGVSSEFLKLLTLQQSFDQASNGRSLIWFTCFNMLKEAPFFGYGVMGERNIVYDIGFQWGYAHNIFLEILVAFGWFLGIIIIVCLILGIVRFFATSNNRNEKLVFLIFLTISFELLVSNSIWLHSGLWCLMGLYMNHSKSSMVSKHRFRHFLLSNHLTK